MRNHAAVFTAYALSLLWVALFAGALAITTTTVELVFVDFVHGNPHRTQANAIFIMSVMSPILGLIISVMSFIVFAPSQLLQALGVVISSGIFAKRSHFAALLVLPISASLTWYAYEYLTPTDFDLGINAGPDWVPFLHGLTLNRYLKALAFQAPVTLFNFFYGFRPFSRRTLIIIALTAVGITGGIVGYLRAVQQFQFS